MQQNTKWLSKEGEIVPETIWLQPPKPSAGTHPFLLCMYNHICFINRKVFGCSE